MENNFSMEWTIFSMEWKKFCRMEYGKIVFHSIACPAGEALRIRVKKFKQTLRENYANSTKIRITACKFSKFFLGSIPPNPPKAFLFLNQLQICAAKKNTLEKT